MPEDSEFQYHVFSLKSIECLLKQRDCLQKEYENLRVSDYENLDPILERIYSSDTRRSFIVFKFFRDMDTQFREMFRVLESGSRYCVTIGNNLIRGVEVRSDQILSEIATVGPVLNWSVQSSRN